jgi:Winged helix-turn helix
MGWSGRAGRRRKLSDEQLARVEAALLAGPRPSGFATEMWTLAWVAEVIERVTGVRYSQAQTWVVLREWLGWSRQRPARRAAERDEGAIAAWVKRTGRRQERRPAPRRLASVPGRRRGVSAAACAGHLDAKGQDPRAAAPVQLEAAVDVRRLPTSLTPAARPGLPDQGRLLQHRIADRLPGRPARAPRRGTGHADLGQPARPQVHGHDGLDRCPATMAAGRAAAAWLRPRPQPGRNCSGATSRPWNWPTSARTLSARLATPPRMA